VNARKLLAALSLLSLPLAFAVVAPTRAHAEDFFTADQLVAKARLSRIDYLDAIDILKRQIPLLPTRELVMPFVDKVDELRQIEIDLGFSVFQAAPLEETAPFLMKAAIPFIDLSQDSSDRLFAFTRWSDDSVRHLFTKKVAILARGVSDKATLDHAFQVFADAETYLALPTTDTATFAIEEYERVLGIIFERLMGLYGKDVSIEDLDHYLDGTQTVVSLAPAMDTLHRQAFLVSSSEDVDHLLRIVLHFKHRVDLYVDPTNPQDAALPGQIILDAIFRVLQTGITPGADVAPESVAVMDDLQVDSLGARLSQLPIERLDMRQFEFIDLLARTVSDRLGTMGLVEDRRQVEIMLEKLLLARALAEGQVEGFYQAQGGGKDLFIAVMRLGLTELATNVTINGASFAQTYAAVNTRTRVFETTNYSPGDQADTTHWKQNLDFEVAGDEIVGTWDNGFGEISFRGSRVGSIPDYLRNAEGPTLPVEGTYVGAALGRSLKVIVTRNGLGYAANAVFDYDQTFTRIEMPLTVGFNDPRRNVLYLSNRGSADSGLVAQLRGRLVEGGFEGVYVVGGRGTVAAVRLRKL
jgi:hypothetical protein